MKSLKFYPTNINRRYIDETVSALRDGKLIIYPTDTLYAIGCDALNNRAIEKDMPHKKASIRPNSYFQSYAATSHRQPSMPA